MTTAATSLVLATSGWRTARDAGALVFGLLWLASAFWVFKDARRRIASRWLIGLGVPARAGDPVPRPDRLPLLLRPPEYLEDVRERELEVRAIEERLRVRSLECPVCRAHGRVVVRRLPDLHDASQAGVRGLRRAARDDLAGMPVLRNARTGRRSVGWHCRAIAAA